MEITAKGLDSKLLSVGQSQQVHKGYIKLHSIHWRVRHILLYAVGGIIFIVGSCFYVPKSKDYTVGGILYTVGSILLFSADAQEWWKNKRIGCAFDAKYRDEFERIEGGNFPPPHTLLGQVMRAETGLYYAATAFGSLLFIVGSILLIPSSGAFRDGAVVFVLGCAIVVAASAAKIWERGRIKTPGSGEAETHFKLSNLSDDRLFVGKEISAGVGALLYLVGSIYFLPACANESYGAGLFIIGSLFYMVSAMFLYCRYFCTDEFPRIKEEQ
ncbi:hypothetical protein B484DRAFT_88312 [Ochromonadaceae sp. CCMP2298]|nr:hypothetical protein B484DRAFT_88312 [Ochromonadaceae sp. CCMP2298]